LFLLFIILFSLFRTHSPQKKPQKETKPLCSIAGLVVFMSFVVAHHTHLHIVTFISILVYSFTYCYIYQHPSVVFLKKEKKEKRERYEKIKLHSCY
jgi:hypothetical protein